MNRHQRRRLAKWQEFNARRKELDELEGLYTKEPQRAIDRLNDYMRRYPIAKERSK